METGHYARFGVMTALHFIAMYILMYAVESPGPRAKPIRGSHVGLLRADHTPPTRALPGYPIRFWKRAAANDRMPAPMTVSATYCSHSASSPAPLRKIVRTISR
jgi:hypothetical protein